MNFNFSVHCTRTRLFKMNHENYVSHIRKLGIVKKYFWRDLFINFLFLVSINSPEYTEHLSPFLSLAISTFSPQSCVRVTILEVSFEF